MGPVRVTKLDILFEELLIEYRTFRAFKNVPFDLEEQICNLIFMAVARLL